MEETGGEIKIDKEFLEEKGRGKELYGKRKIILKCTASKMKE